MNTYNIVAENNESTVVSDFKSDYHRGTEYESEASLEKAFIEQLKLQAYDYLPIKQEKDLISNLRTQLEKLNDYKFTDVEWDSFFKAKLANGNNGIEEKTTIIQEDYIQLLQREDGTV